MDAKPIGTTEVYAVMIMLADGVTQYQLCACDTPEKAGAVVATLFNAGRGRPAKVIVEVHYA